MNSYWKNHKHLNLHQCSTSEVDFHLTGQGTLFEMKMSNRPASHRWALGHVTGSFTGKQIHTSPLIGFILQSHMMTEARSWSTSMSSNDCWISLPSLSKNHSSVKSTCVSNHVPRSQDFKKYPHSGDSNPTEYKKLCSMTHSVRIYTKNVTFDFFFRCCGVFYRMKFTFSFFFHSSDISFLKHVTLNIHFMLLEPLMYYLMLHFFDMTT